GGAQAHLLRGRVERVAFQVLVVEEPIARVEDFLRVYRCGQDLGHEWIGIERDGSDQLLESVRRPGSLRDHFGGRGAALRLGVLCRRLRLVLLAAGDGNDERHEHEPAHEAKQIPFLHVASPRLGPRERYAPGAGNHALSRARSPATGKESWGKLPKSETEICISTREIVFGSGSEGFL